MPDRSTRRARPAVYDAVVDARNTAYVIHITTKSGRTWTHQKERDGWTRVGPNGRVHTMTAEQLLSHLLPPLAADQPGLSVRVERRNAPAETKAPVRAKSLPVTSRSSGLARRRPSA